MSDLFERNQSTIKISAQREDKGKRIDIFLFESKFGLSRSKIQKLIKFGKVTVEGRQSINKSYILEGNEVIFIDIEGFEDIGKEPLYSPQKIEINIIYEDEYMFAVSKPAGMVVHPGAGNKENTLLNAILYYNKNSKYHEAGLRAGIVHRLDKDTSGIVLVAKDYDTQQSLTRLFKERKIKKTYTALVFGNFKEKYGLIDMPITRSKKNKKAMDVSIKGKESLTEFTVIKNYERCSLLTINPKTGRTHQIRVHFSSIGHPIIGDKVYGNKETESLAESIDLKRQFLHAERISFMHPATNQPIEIIDNIPEDLKNSIEKLK
jgi:23S rRNA pseudouridine1911/1915/1917 synthase